MGWCQPWRLALGISSVLLEAGASRVLQCQICAWSFSKGAISGKADPFHLTLVVSPSLGLVARGKRRIRLERSQPHGGRVGTHTWESESPLGTLGEGAATWLGKEGQLPIDVASPI